MLSVWFQPELALPVVAPDSRPDDVSVDPRKLNGSSSAAPNAPAAPGIRSASAGIIGADAAWVAAGGARSSRPKSSGSELAGAAAAGANTSGRAAAAA